MKLDNVHSLEKIIDEWDGQIVLDAYELEAPKGMAILSLTREGKIENAINFEGEQKEVILLFKEILWRNRDKVIKYQKEYLEKFLKW